MVDIPEDTKKLNALYQAGAELKLLRKLLDHSGDAIEVIDLLTLRFLDVNDTACRALGYSREELLTMVVSDIDPGLNPAVTEMINEQRRQSGAAHFESTRRRKDGSVFAVEVSMGFVTVDRPYALSIVRDITARRQAAEALRQSEEKFRSLLESTTDWVWEVGADGCYTFASPSVETLLGYKPQEVIGKRFFDFMPLGEAQRVGAIFSEILRQRKPINALKNINRHKNGRLVVLESSGSPFFGSDGKFAGYRGIDRDITERQRAQDEIVRLATFPRFHPSPVIELDAAGNVTYLNPAAEKLFPDLRRQGQLHPLLRGSGELIASLRQDGRQEEKINEVGIGDATYELYLFYVQEVDLIRVYVRDITLRKRNEEAVYLLATTDSLTGIANRREFVGILTREMDQAKRYGLPLALAMYDLDNFKRINDTFGHDVGDQVLQIVTGLVRENIRAADVVARWGGEEFMVLMPQADISAAANMAEKLRREVAGHPFKTVDQLTVSFGVVIYEPQDDMHSLLKRVDDALYLAKARGRNRVAVLTGDAAGGAGDPGENV